MRLGLLCSFAALLVACGSSKPPKSSPADGGAGGTATAGRGGSGGKAGNAGRGGGGGSSGSASGGRGGSGAEGGEAGAAAGGASGGSSGSDGATGGSAGEGASTSGGGAGSDGVGGTGATSGAAGSDAGGSAGAADRGGTGGGPECSEPTDCPRARPFCEEGACVECLPSADDCPAGSYCSPDFECVRGCREDDDCASGRCLANHSCDRCLVDDECRAGLVCGSGTCGQPCSEPGDCGALSCCDGRCVDVTRDIAHCGACGGEESPNTCSVDEFCGGGGCNDATIANVCDTALVTVVEDGLAPDEAAAAALGAALVSGCSPSPDIRTVAEATTDALNPSSGRPVIGGGEVLVIAGGPFGQAVMYYLENERIAPVYSGVSGDDYVLWRSSDDMVLGSIPSASSGDAQDLLLIEVVRDPASGTFLLVTYGFSQYGTAAAVWYLENVMVPGPLTTYDQRYYVIAWTDDGDATPDADDTFDVLTSG